MSLLQNAMRVNNTFLSLQMIDFFGRQRTNSTFKKNKRKHAFHNLETMERVLILFHYKDWMQIQLVANDLERMGKKVLLWTVESSDETVINIRIPLVMRTLSKKDFSNFGLLRSKTEKEFKNLRYDTLIDFCKEDGDGIEYLTYLLAINKAEFCIGNRWQDERIYDFTVIQNKNKGVLETFWQMKGYLEKIKP